VVGDGFVYVRGLGDRYSLALLNGLPLPSPEPLKRVVPLDIFPTDVVASSLVQKSYSANYPGEFGGGVINLTTVAVPDESFLSIGVSGGANTETTFQTGYDYFGSDRDFTGFRGRSRDPGPALDAFLNSGARLSEGNVDVTPIIGDLVKPDFAIAQKIETPADFSASATGGTAFDLGDARIGVVATASYGNDWRTRDIRQQTPLREDLTALRFDGRTVNTENNLTLNGLLSLGAEIGEHRLRFTNLYIHDTVKQTRLGETQDVDINFDRFTQSTAWYERQLIDTQFVGEFEFGDLGVDLRAGYANVQRDVPYETDFLYVRTNGAGPLADLAVNRLDGGALGGASVAFSELEEDLYYGGIDLSYLIAPNFGISAGYAHTDTARDVSRREFQITAPSTTPSGVFLLRPDLLINQATAEAFDFDLFEGTEGSPAFNAGLVIDAAYAKLNWEVIDYVTLDLGVRYETADQTVANTQVFTNPVVGDFSNQLSNEYWLPGGTITWEPSADLQLRLNASKTIARPQFRELLPILYFDPETNRSFRGNPLLVDSELFNAEARAEYYFGGPDRLSVASFFKRIDNPIETAINFGANGTVGNFANAPRADLMGVELDAVKYFDLFDMGSIFASRQFFVIANYTFTDSKLKVGPDDLVQRFGRAPIAASEVFTDGTPLTGQSDHIANLQFGLESTERTSQQTILVKYASERVIGRGDGDFPDIVEDPGVQVDFVWRESFPLFGLATNWKFEARNIFNENFEEFQATDAERIEINTYDLGTSFSLGVSLDF
jgi:outer membrane receptor protein involved in Fe transport